MKKRKVIRRLPQAMLLLLCLTFVFAARQMVWASEATVISNMKVEVQAVDGYPALPLLVTKRMAASIAAVGEQILLGHKVAEVRSEPLSYEHIIQTVFDKVLTGYTIRGVRIAADETAVITVQVVPWGDTVQQVEVELVAGPYAAANPLLAQDCQALQGLAEQSLLGVPADAMDWASIAAKGLLREALAEDLPEFAASIEVVPGIHTVVRITLLPTGTIIQEVNTELQSTSIPNLFLLPLRSDLEDIGQQLQSLPAAFVERHKEYFIGKLMETARQRSLVKQYGLQIKPMIETGRSTRVALQVDTDRYRIWLESYVDIGRMNNNTSAKLHIGKYVGRQDELFLETAFEAGSVAWKFAPGWGHQLGSSLEVGLKYQLDEQGKIAWFDYRPHHNWLLRFEQNLRTSDNQLAVRYRLHDLLSLEYVKAQNDQWLRLVGNL